MASFDNIKVGQVLYSPVKTRSGMSYHTVHILEIDQEGRRVRVLVVGPDRWVTERRLATYRVNKPEHKR